MDLIIKNYQDKYCPDLIQNQILIKKWVNLCNSSKTITDLNSKVLYLNNNLIPSLMLLISKTITLDFYSLTLTLEKKK